MASYRLGDITASKNAPAVLERQSAWGRAERYCHIIVKSVLQFSNSPLNLTPLRDSSLCLNPQALRGTSNPDSALFYTRDFSSTLRQSLRQNLRCQ